jgi:hypothetical protein
MFRPVLLTTEKPFAPAETGTGTAVSETATIVARSLLIAGNYIWKKYPPLLLK